MKDLTTAHDKRLDDTNKTQIVAQRFIERAAALGLKGKKADSAALDYFLGAACAAELTGNEAFRRHLDIVSVMIVAVRGMFGVREIANAIPATLPRPQRAAEIAERL
jgi:hypothetical protein